VTWTSRTTSAPWAARFGHTSVIDAAGAIYVIGGEGGGTSFQDVWASTDGGAARPGSRGCLEAGYYGGTTKQGYSWGTSRVLKCTIG
jgi:hypothetical protein